MRKNSKKNNMINSQMKKILSYIILNDIKDPKLNSMTSVTDVIVAPDLKTAKVYISVLSDGEHLKLSVDILNKAEGFIRHRVAEELNLRLTPKLTFIADNSMEYGAYISNLVNKLHENEKNDSDEMSI